MFGYVVINKPDLRFREYDEYRGLYCGLCSKLKEEYGLRGQIALNYDMNFLVVLLSALYEPDNTVVQKRCVMHPLTKQTKITNQYSEYCADMTIVLTYFKCVDDWDDEKSVVKLAYRRLLEGHMDRIRKKYPDKVQAIAKYLEENARCEKDNESNIDMAANHTGRMMAEIFAYQHDEWENTMRNIGFYLGKYIYLMDAYDDIEKDKKNGDYNVLIAQEIQHPDDFDQYVQGLLETMLASCADSFERLPLLRDADIIRNILYAGVWTKFELVKKDRNEKKAK